MTTNSDEIDKIAREAMALAADATLGEWRAEPRHVGCDDRIKLGHSLLDVAKWDQATNFKDPDTGCLGWDLCGPAHARWSVGRGWSAPIDTMYAAHALTHHAETTRAVLQRGERIRVLEKALRDVHAWRGVGEGALETFERIGDLFYRDTGMLRPGKDQAAALGGYPTDQQRRDAWVAWCARKNKELDDAIDTALRGEVSK